MKQNPFVEFEGFEKDSWTEGNDYRKDCTKDMGIILLILLRIVMEDEDKNNQEKDYHNDSL